LKYFICSDIHSNVRAMDAVMEVYRDEYPCHMLFLGDCIGYGPHPNGCMQRMLNIPESKILMGNHEWALLNKLERRNLSQAALEALEWTDGVLSAEFHKAIEDRFMMTYRKDNLLAAHSSPFKPEAWSYIHNLFDAQESFTNEDFEVCFVGHTHVAGVFSFFSSQEWHPGEGEEFSLKPGERYIINPGSVGQPRDGDPRAAFCIYDSQERKVLFQRVEYDVAATVEEFREAGLPEILAERLLIGA
jgi:diadenosine tetraphosphatase ApaH/serine/threonine PP2A family protein phosphatase